MKKIRIAGPPGTGKTRRLVKIFYDNIQKYSATEIIMTSHTNTAADEIRDRILDDANIQKYQDETGNDIFRKVKESKKTLEETVTTIHTYCLSKIQKKGVKKAFITLHIGLGTFKPILVEDLTRHHMDSESYEVPEKTADCINLARKKKKNICL